MRGFIFVENSTPPSLRPIHIGLSTIMAYEGILGDEIDQFHRAIEVVGKALENTDLHALEGKLPWTSLKLPVMFCLSTALTTYLFLGDVGMYNRKRNIYQSMKKLLLQMV